MNNKLDPNVKYVYVKQPDGSIIAVPQPQGGQGAPQSVTQYVQPPQPTAPKEKSERRVKVEKAAASTSSVAMLILAGVYSLLFTFALINGHFTGIGLAIAVGVFYLMFTPFILTRDHRPRAQAIFLAVPVAALAVSRAFTPTGANKGVLMLLFLMAFQLVFMGRCSESPLGSVKSLADLFTVGFGYTFSNIGTAYSSLGKGGEKKEKEDKGHVAAKVLIGLAIALPIVIVLTAILSAADPAFGEVVGKIVKFFVIDIEDIYLVIVLGVPMTFLLFPFILTLRSGSAPKRSKMTVGRWCDPTVAAVISFAVSLVYILFIIVETKYLFISTSTPPQGYTYAQYARKGVAELCVVTVLTFAAVIFFTVFSKKNENGKTPMILRIALTVVTACSMVIVASAFYRLCCDVFFYGMTVNRLFAFVFTAFLAISLVTLLVKQWVEKLNVASAVVAAGICLLTIFFCCNAKKITAEYNVDRYLADPKTTSIDMEYMLHDMDYSAAPALERLYNNAKDEKIKAQALGIIASYYYDNSANYAGEYLLCDLPLGGWTVDAQRALNVIDRLKPERSAMDALKDIDRYFYYYYDDKDETQEPVDDSLAEETVMY